MTKNPKAGSLFVVLLAMTAVAQCALFAGCNDQSKTVTDTEKLVVTTTPFGSPSPVSYEHVHVEK